MSVMGNEYPITTIFSALPISIAARFQTSRRPPVDEDLVHVGGTSRGSGSRGVPHTWLWPAIRVPNGRASARPWSITGNGLLRPHGLTSVGITVLHLEHVAQLIEPWSLRTGIFT